MAQVVRERAARLFDSLDEMGDVPPHLPGSTPKRSRMNSKQTYQGISGTTIYKKRRKVAAGSKKVGKHISPVSDGSANYGMLRDEAHPPEPSKLGPKRLDFSEKTVKPAFASSILDAAFNEQPPSSLYTTSKGGAASKGSRQADISNELPPPWAGDSLLFQ